MDLRIALSGSDTTIYLYYNSDTNTIIEQCTSKNSIDTLYKIRTKDTGLSDLYNRLDNYINYMGYKLVSMYDYNKL